LKIFGYKIIGKRRRQHRGRPGWQLKLRANDKVWVDDEGPVWVLTMNDDPRDLFRKTSW
jgi:hypothetical protein